ncbi:MAG: hypothetical protein IJG69_03390 [Spirochaetales bacterium]|nr:hypothetical protein [Spirochaetales bacterium]
MSDVLIKGTRFKKPKSCFTHGGVYCPFHVESFNEKYHACTLTGSEVKCNRLSKDCPLVEVKQGIKQGKWVEIEEDVYECSVCGEAYILDDTPKAHKYHFCPNCGSRMEVEHGLAD